MYKFDINEAVNYMPQIPEESKDSLGLGWLGRWRYADAIDDYNESSGEVRANALRRATDIGRDTMDELSLTRNGSFMDKLTSERGKGYGLSIGSGIIMGLLLSDGSFGDKLKSSLLYGGLGALANFARRKSYYGSNIDW